MPEEIKIFEITLEDLEKLSKGRKIELADSKIQLSKNAMELVE